MAVTTSSGNGFALYNGVKLPNINTVWTDSTKYPYALTVGDMQFGMVLFSSEPLVCSNGLVSNDVVLSVAYYLIAEDGSWELLVESDDVPIGEVTADGVGWTSHDILNTDNSVYLAASDPIPLDGMNVIEWDGDTTGLDGVEGLVRIGDYIPQPTTGVSVLHYISDLVVWQGIQIAPEYGDGFWGSAEFVFGFPENNTSGIPSGLYFASSVGLYTQLFAYPASSEPTYDRTAFLSGLAMGLCGKGNPTFEGSGKYLYNGMKFPKLPERDKSTYPYAVITYGNLLPQFENNVSLYFLKEIRYSELGGLYVYNGLKTPSTAYSDDFVWGELQESISGSAVAPQWLHWANTDILGSNGTVNLAASDPVPVEDTFTKGYHVGAELRRKRVLPEKEPVAYLYNGVRLPKLPEWDKETYPYAFINYGGWLYPNSLELYVCKEFTFDGSEVHYTAESLRTPLTEYSEDFAWGDFGPSSGGDVARNWILWTNTDLVNSDGTVYLAATDPVPVYE